MGSIGRSWGHAAGFSEIVLGKGQKTSGPRYLLGWGISLAVGGFMLDAIVESGAAQSEMIARIGGLPLVTPSTT